MRVKFSQAEMEGFINAISNAIDLIITSEPYSDDADLDNLIISTFEEMKMHCQLKFFKKRKKYGITLKPNWGFAIRWFFAPLERKNFEGALMGLLCDSIHETYSTKAKLLTHENS